MTAYIVDEWTMIILRSIIILVIALFAKYGLPYIQSLTVYDYVEKMVYAAEQLFGAGTGEKKKENVIKWVKDFCEKKHIKITEEQISLLIESACLYVDAIDGITVIEDTSADK